MQSATYETEETAIAGALRNWINFVKEQVPAGLPAKKSDGEIITTLDGLSDEQIGELKLVGMIEGTLITDNGTTIAYTAILKANDLELWYYILPPDRYMLGVLDCVIQPFNPDWGAPDA